MLRLTAEPFDVSLSRNVQKLREEADQLTAEVIKARKSLPMNRANAIQAQFEVMDDKKGRREQGRRKIEADAEEVRLEKATRRADRRKGEIAEIVFHNYTLKQIPAVTLERPEQVGATLESAVRDIENLSVVSISRPLSWNAA